MFKKVIAIDFDGIIVEDTYPHIGKLKPKAREVINELISQGHEVIIWSCRDACEIEEFLYKQDIKFTTINENTFHLMDNWGNDPRKVGADVYIDDKNIETTTIDWDRIEFHLKARKILK